MGKINTTTIYDFPNENFRKKFNTREDALKHIEGKLPANGKDWVLRKTVTTVEEETIVSERKLIENKEIIKKIVDEFIKKATVDNVKFDSYENKLTDNRYARFSNFTATEYLFAEKVGFPWEKLDDWFNNKDGILEGRFDNYYGTEMHYNNKKETEFPACHLAHWYVISEMFNIDLNDITIENENYGRADRSKKEGKKYVHYIDPTTLAAKYPKAKKYLDDNYDSMGLYHSHISVPMDAQERLDIYKEKLKKYPIEKAVVYYNTGDYRPCHNYKIEFPDEFNPDFTEDAYPTLGDIFWRMPGIMFRNEDIYVTQSDYIGRHVNHTGKKRVDETEELYKYCIKNLK